MLAQYCEELVAKSVAELVGKGLLNGNKTKLQWKITGIILGDLDFTLKDHEWLLLLVQNLCIWRYYCIVYMALR